VIRELLISFFICLVIGAIINGWNNATAPVPNPPPETTQTPAPGDQGDANQGAATGTSTTSDPSNSGASTGSSSGQAKPKDTVSLKAPETSDSSFEKDVLKSQVPVLVDFNASWCAPCQVMAPIVDTLCADYNGKIKVYKVDVDRNPALKERFQVSSIPTFVMFRNGRAVSQYSGAMAKEMLAGVIDHQLGTQ
jgi:thioredoxin 1